MTSPISNPLSSYYIRIPEETISSNHQLEASFIDESYGDNMRTSKWEIVYGLYRRGCRLLPEWQISRRDLLIEATGCLAVAILVTLATRCLHTTMNSEMVEFIQNQAEGVMQNVTRFIQNENDKVLQYWVKETNDLDRSEEAKQFAIEEMKEVAKNLLEKNLQLYGGNLKNQTEKIMQIFADPKLRKENGGFWWPTGITCTVIAVSRTVTAALKPYFPA